MEGDEMVEMTIEVPKRIDDELRLRAATLRCSKEYLASLYMAIVVTTAKEDFNEV